MTYKYNFTCNPYLLRPEIINSIQTEIQNIVLHNLVSINYNDVIILEFDVEISIDDNNIISNIIKNYDNTDTPLIQTNKTINFNMMSKKINSIYYQKITSTFYVGPTFDCNVTAIFMIAHLESGTSYSIKIIGRATFNEQGYVISESTHTNTADAIIQLPIVSNKIKSKTIIELHVKAINVCVIDSVVLYLNE